VPASQRDRLGTSRHLISRVAGKSAGAEQGTSARTRSKGGREGKMECIGGDHADCTSSALILMMPLSAAADARGADEIDSSNV